MRHTLRYLTAGVRLKANLQVNEFLKHLHMNPGYLEKIENIKSRSDRIPLFVINKKH